MKIIQNIVVVSTYFILLACVPTQQQIKTAYVQLPPERSYHRGFSLIPLNEDGWIINQKDYNWLILGRYGSSQEETYVISTDIWGPPTVNSQSEFFETIKENQTRNLDTTRYTRIDFDVKPYPKKGEYCARIYIKTEDNAAVTHGGVVDHMILEMLALSCRHPKNTNMAIDVTYSHRHFPEKSDPLFSKKAEVLFDSVEFTDLK